MLLTQTQKYRSVEQCGKSSDKPTQIWSPHLRKRRQEYAMDKRQSLLEVVLGILVSYM